MIGNSIYYSDGDQPRPKRYSGSTTVNYHGNKDGRLEIRFACTDRSLSKGQEDE